MITIIALVLQVLMGLITPAQSDVTIIPPMPQHAPLTSPEYCTPNCECWECYHDDAYGEYYDAFTALFNSYEVKRAKNGAIMIRRGNKGSYKFAKKGS